MDLGTHPVIFLSSNDHHPKRERSGTTQENLRFYLEMIFPICRLGSPTCKRSGDWDSLVDLGVRGILGLWECSKILSSWNRAEDRSRRVAIPSLPKTIFVYLYLFRKEGNPICNFVKIRQNIRLDGCTHDLWKTIVLQDIDILVPSPKISIPSSLHTMSQLRGLFKTTWFWLIFI